MNTHTLFAEALQKSYHHRHVVRHCSIRVNSGMVVGLLGPNGSGKTTTFSMIAGLVKPDAGKLILDGKNITQQPFAERARLGISYLPQSASIFRQLTVAENILAVLELRHTLTKKAQHIILEELIARFNIDTIRDSLGMHLSGGERRRVEIARMLAMSPKFVLLDEPFAGVDPIAVNEIKHTITALQKDDMGVLITDHNVRETLSACQYAYIIHAGTLIAEGTPEEILANSSVRSVYLGEQFEL